MEPEQFRIDVDDAVAVVTFDRPPVNAQNRRTREELIWIRHPQRPGRRQGGGVDRGARHLLRRRRHLRSERGW